MLAALLEPDEPDDEPEEPDEPDPPDDVDRGAGAGRAARGVFPAVTDVTSSIETERSAAMMFIANSVARFSIVLLSVLILRQQ